MNFFLPQHLFREFKTHADSKSSFVRVLAWMVLFEAEGAWTMFISITCDQQKKDLE